MAGLRMFSSVFDKENGWRKSFGGLPIEGIPNRRKVGGRVGWPSWSISSAIQWLVFGCKLTTQTRCSEIKDFNSLMSLGVICSKGRSLPNSRIELSLSKNTTDSCLPFMKSTKALIPRNSFVEKFGESFSVSAIFLWSDYILNYGL